MKKKVWNLLFCAVMTSALIMGCGGGENADVPAPGNAEAEKVETDAPAAESVNVTEEEDTESIPAETATEKETLPAEEAAAKGIEDYEPGTWEGTVYTNSALGITMTLPDTYTVLTGNALKEAMGQAADEVMEGSDLKNVDMSGVVYDFIGISPDQVSNILFSVEENTMKLSSEEYGQALLESMNLLGASYEMLADPESMMVGDIDFYEIDMVIDYSEATGIEGYTAVQSYIIHAEEDLLYYFTVTWTEDSMEEIAEILNSMQPVK